MTLSLTEPAIVLANSGARTRDCRHMPALVWAGYHLKNCLAQDLPTLYRIFQVSKQHLFLDSSQDTEAGDFIYYF